MNINVGAKIHNRFYIEVRDAKTNEIKQDAVAHNIVLNTALTRLTNGYGWFTDISFGTGSGELSPDRTTLFTALGYKSIVAVSVTYDFPVSWRRVSITLNPEEYVGSTITEVGLSGGTSLCTHALLTDSEGNPVSITKSDTDVLVIYATIYAEVTLPAGFAPTIYRTPLMSQLLGYVNGPYSTVWLGRKSIPSSAYSLPLGDTYTASDVLGKTPSVVADTITYSRRYGPVRFSVAEANTTIGELYLQGYRAKLTDIPGINPYLYENVIIGVGDGNTNIFEVPSLDVLADTLEVKKDGETSIAYSLYKGSKRNYDLKLDIIGAQGYSFGPSMRYGTNQSNVFCRKLSWENVGAFDTSNFNEFYHRNVSDNGEIVVVGGRTNYIYTWKKTDSGYAPLPTVTMPVTSIAQVSADGRYLLCIPITSQSASIGAYLYEINEDSWQLLAGGIGVSALNFLEAEVNLFIEGNRFMLFRSNQTVEFYMIGVDDVSLQSSLTTTHPLHLNGANVSKDGSLFCNPSSNFVEVFEWSGTEWSIGTLLEAPSVFYAAPINATNIVCCGRKASFTKIGSEWIKIEDTGTERWYSFYVYMAFNEDTLHLLVADTTGGSYSATYDVAPRTTFIVFDEPPAEGVAITADYAVDGFHKTDQYVLDVGYTIQYAEGSA